MARRTSEVELCFDSMTDLITNLAGGLILVVMILLALTREAPRALDLRPAGTAGKPAADEKPTRELVDRLNNLHADLARVNDAVGADERLLKELDEKAAALIERTKAAGAGATPPETK